MYSTVCAHGCSIRNQITLVITINAFARTSRHVGWISHIVYYKRELREVVGASTVTKSSVHSQERSPRLHRRLQFSQGEHVQLKLVFRVFYAKLRDAKLRLGFG